MNARSQHGNTASAAADNSIKVIDLYQATETIHPRAVQGRFDRLRKVLRWVGLAVLAGVPWLRWDGRQAVLIDLDSRRALIFDLVIVPQDVVFAAGMLVIGALGLFAVTAWAGRVWCGYACPQSVWSAIFFGIEQWLEGRPAKRKALDEAPWGARKLGLRVVKYSLFLLVSVATAFSVVAWFNPAPQLLANLLTLDLGGGVAFWLLFLTAGTFVAGGLLREQVCFYMCPYARFQSAMFDQDTLVISYDPKRGEPRGRGRGRDDTGDCVDCSLCVQVCPSGIDIRDGLQYQCISCGLCIDACDGVMDSLERPRGLIRYTTERALAGNARHGPGVKVYAYGAVLAVACAVFAMALWERDPARLDVFRDRQQLYRVVETADGPLVRNSFRLRVTNMSSAPAAFTLAVVADNPALALRLVAPDPVQVPAGGLRDVPVQVEVQLADAAARSGQHAEHLHFTATRRDDPAISVRHEAQLWLPGAP